MLYFPSKLQGKRANWVVHRSIRGMFVANRREKYWAEKTTCLKLNSCSSKRGMESEGKKQEGMNRHESLEIQDFRLK